MTTRASRGTPPTRPPGTRPSSPAGSGAGDALSVALSAAVAAGLVALIGIALSLIITVGSWSLAPHTADSGPDGASRLAVALWLYAHHVPLEIDGLSLGLVPLGLLLLPGALAYAGGRQVARVTRPRRVPDLTGAVIPYALVYGIVAAIAAGVIRSEDVQPAPLRAFVAGTLLAAVAGTLGMVRAAGLGGQVRELVPSSLRDVLAAGTVALATVVTVSAVTTALALAVGFPDAVEMFRTLDAGLAGGPVLLLMTVAFLPNLVLWTASFTTGVGFLLGADGSVTPQGIDYGALPVFPPLAAMPPEGEPGVWAYLVLLTPTPRWLRRGLPHRSPARTVCGSSTSRPERGLGGALVGSRSAVWLRSPPARPATTPSPRSVRSVGRSGWSPASRWPSWQQWSRGSCTVAAGRAVRD